jgi:acetyltransferase-like isoleucine patch superfamily enzyme
MPTETYPPDSPPVIEIGDRTTVGKDCWFVARHSIVLEADVTIAPNVYFTDHNHTYADPWLPVGKQVLQGFSVRVGSGTWIGTNVVVLPGANIGRNCAIAAGAVVRGNIPDHSVVVGVPGRVVRRWIDGEGWVPPLTNEVVVVEGWPVGVRPTEK